MLEKTCNAIANSIKEDVHDIKSDLRNIKDNHLHTIEESINKMKGVMWFIPIVLTIVQIIIGVLL